MPPLGPVATEAFKAAQEYRSSSSSQQLDEAESEIRNSSGGIARDNDGDPVYSNIPHFARGNASGATKQKQSVEFHKRGPSKRSSWCKSTRYIHPFRSSIDPSPQATCRCLRWLDFL